MARENEIETTDTRSNRIAIAAKSQERWYKKEHNAIVRDCLRLETDILEASGSDLAELEKQLRKKRGARTELNEGMAMSALQVDMSTSPGDDTFSYSESRIGLNAPALTAGGTSRLQADGDQVLKMYGIAAVTGQKTVVADCYEEIIQVGAFRKCLEGKPDCRLLIDHDPGRLLARTKNRSLRLYEKPEGLLFWSDLIEDDPLTDATVSRIRTGLLSGCSFCFTVTSDSWELPKKDGDFSIRTIEEVGELFDVTVCCYPCYEQTSCGIFLQDRAERGSDPFVRSAADQARHTALAALDKRIALQKKFTELDGLQSRLTASLRDQKLKMAEAKIKAKQPVSYERQMQINAAGRENDARLRRLTVQIAKERGEPIDDDYYDDWN